MNGVALFFAAEFQFQAKQSLLSGFGGPVMREVVNDPLERSAGGVEIIGDFDVNICDQIQRSDGFRWGLAGLLNDLLQLSHGIIDAVILLGVKHGQLLARFGIVRVFFQMLHQVRRFLRNVLGRRRGVLGRRRGVLGPSGQSENKSAELPA